MLRSRSSLFWVLIATFLFVSNLARAADERPRVTHKARSLQLGEVVALRVAVPKAADEVEARAFTKVFPFYSNVSGQDSVWEGLVGIDLDVEPGSHEILISAAKDGTVIFEVPYIIQVLPKDFPVRRITVEKKYASPPKEELDRIQKESREVSGIFSNTTPEKFWQGAFLRPVPGEAISSFGKRSIINGQPRSPHSGTDFRAAAGTPIKAPNAGKVVLVRDLFFAGNTVILDHGQGLYSYFAHLSKFDVSEGEFVERGHAVGEVGATGRVTGPHLHWTLRLAGARVDPLSLMSLLESAE